MLGMEQIRAGMMLFLFALLSGCVSLSLDSISFLHLSCYLTTAGSRGHDRPEHSYTSPARWVQTEKSGVWMVAYVTTS